MNQYYYVGEKFISADTLLSCKPYDFDDQEVNKTK